jgi:hypothetical protein
MRPHDVGKWVIGNAAKNINNRLLSGHCLLQPAQVLAYVPMGQEADRKEHISIDSGLI